MRIKKIILRIMPCWLIVVIKKIKAWINANYFALLYTLSKNKLYKFNKNDICLYINECSTMLKKKSILSEDDDILLYAIDGRKLYWPAKYSADDIPWLYHEIFDKWTRNPSSYSHPMLGINSADWAIDGGACEGFFGLFLHENDFSGRLILVDPVPDFKKALNSTFSLLKLEKKVEILNYALGNSNKSSVISIDDNHLCESSFDSLDNRNTRMVTVKVHKIDNIVGDFKLSGRGIIKLDVEGAEMDALEGARETLIKQKPTLAVAVYHGYENAHKCMQIIKDARPDYKIEFRGFYGYCFPPRPYLLFAY